MILQVQIITERRIGYWYNIKDSKDTWHVLSTDLYIPLLNLRLSKVPKVLERQWRHCRLNQLGIPEWMRKGEGQDLTRRWTSSGECNGNFAATKRRLWRPRYTKCAHCRYVHISRPIPGCWGMRFTVGILLSRQVRMLFVREIWPDPVAYHLPSASAEIFHERKIPRGPEKRRAFWGMRFSTEHLPMKFFKLFRRVFAYREMHFDLSRKN